MIIHNCHVHIFTNRAIPNRLLPLRAIQLTRPRLVGKLVRNILDTLPSDRLDRLAAFVGIGSKKSQAAILDHLVRFYPGSTRFVVLAMDFEQAGAGKAPQSYSEQLEELRGLKADPRFADRLLPFVAVDPRRDGVFELAREYLEDHGFAGIKLYPPLGFFPDDPRMDPIYEYAQTHQVPILAHCSRGGVFYRGEITYDMRRHPRTGQVIPETDREKFVQIFADPKNYRGILERFPDLKINLAHFGGSQEWRKYLDDPWPGAEEESWLSVICDLMRAHPNVYGDISFMSAREELWPLVKVLLNTETIQDRMLFGTDYYMVRREAEERVFGVKMRAFVGEGEFQRLAETNSKRYLEPTQS